MIEELCNGITMAWGDDLLAQRSASSGAAKNIYASGFHPCLRRMWHDMHSRDKRPPFTPDVLARMERGNEREADILSRLTRIGKRATPKFEVIGGQKRFEIIGRGGGIIITGKFDAELKVDGRKHPLECKTFHPNIIDRINSQDDLLNSKWTRAADMQILTYLFANNEPEGVLLLDRPGLPKLIPIRLESNFDRVELFLRSAEAVMETGSPDAFEFSTPDECKVCWARGLVCSPSLDFGPGAQVITDEDLISELDLRADVAEAGAEYNRLDKLVKDKLRGCELGIAGEHIITGKWGKSTKYEMPDEIKAKYKVEDPKGRFTIKIVSNKAAVSAEGVAQ